MGKVIDRRRLGALALAATGLGLFGRNAFAQTAAPQTYFFLVFSDPVPGQEDAYARWFKAASAPAIPGIRSVQRFVDAQLVLRKGAVPTPHDLTIYTLVTDHPLETRAAIGRLIDQGGLWPGPAIASVKTWTYRQFRSPMKGVGGEPAGASPGPRLDYLVLAFGDALAGQDAAFNAWYDDVHEPELVANPGVTNARRAMLSAVQMAPPAGQSRYLVFLDMQTSDLPATFRGILKGGPPSPAMDTTKGFGFTYRAVE